MSNAAVVFIVVLSLLGIATLILAFSVYSHIQFQKAFTQIHNHHEKNRKERE